MTVEHAAAERPRPSSAFDGRRRVVPLALRPEVDGGRYPVKRIVGDTFEVEADLVADGHDVLAAVALVRHESEQNWRELPLEHAGNDAWRATLPLTQLGRYRYTVLAWVDAFASWKRGLERKFSAGVDISLELLEGALLVEAAVARGAPLAQSVRILRGALPAGAGSAGARSDADAERRSASPGSAGARSDADAERRSALEERYAHATSKELAEQMARYPDRSLASSYAEREVLVERALAGFSAWYELFPRSTRADGKHGSFKDAEGWLDYIAELGFDIVYLPPIHPIGTAFRKGPDNSPTAGPDDPGSPWAIGGPEGGHTAVHPELGTLADFDHFQKAARDRGLEVALDIAFQASPDHPWVKEHPTWFRQRPDGSIQYAENPPKKYQDVYPFDFETADWQALWAALRDVFLFWARRGVRVFRVDNPHTKPLPFWEWCIREVQAKHPDAVFLSEAFTRPKLMYALAKLGFTQSYTYFAWRTTKWDLTTYGTEVAHPPVADFFRPSFWPTTPDIFPEHLVHGGRGAFVQRVILAGTLSASYGIYGPSYELMEATPRPGVEELARNEKYQIRTWDRDAVGSLRHVIARLNRIRKHHRALHQNRTLRFHPTDNDLVIAYSKTAPDNIILCVVNLDPHHTHRTWLDLDLDALGLPHDTAFQVHDLMSDARFTWRGRRNFVELSPQQMPAHIFEVKRFVRSENQFEYFL